MNTLQKILLLIATMILSSHTLFSQSKPPRKTIELHYSELKLLGKTAVFEKNGWTKKVRDSVDKIVLFIDVLYADSICITPKDFKNVDKLRIAGEVQFPYAELEGLQKFKNITYLYHECVKFDYSKITQWKNLKILYVSQISEPYFRDPKYKIEDYNLVFPQCLDTLAICTFLDYDSEWFRKNCSNLRYLDFGCDLSEDYFESESEVSVRIAGDRYKFWNYDVKLYGHHNNFGVLVDLLEAVIPYVKNKDIQDIPNSNTTLYPIQKVLIITEKDTGMVYQEKMKKYGYGSRVDELPFKDKFQILEENGLVSMEKSKYSGDSLVLYYRNGEIACRGQYKNGFRIGEWQYFYPSLKDATVRKYYNNQGVLDSILTPVQILKSSSTDNGMSYVGKIDMDKYLDTMRCVPWCLSEENLRQYNKKYYTRRADWYPIRLLHDTHTRLLFKDTLSNCVWNVYLLNDTVYMAHRYNPQTMESTEYTAGFENYFPTAGYDPDPEMYWFEQYAGIFSFESSSRYRGKVGTNMGMDKQKDEFLNEVYKTLRYYGYL